MWLKLDLEGLKFELKIENYIPNQTIDGKWANVSFDFEFQNIIKYSRSRNELLLCYEIDELICNIKNLLEDKIEEPKILEEIEPDFTFILTPKNKTRNNDINIEMKIKLWCGGLTCNYFSTTFARDEIEQLYLYLSLITSKVKREDLRIKQLIEKGIIYGDIN